VSMVRQGISRKSTLTQEFEKCLWRKLHKGSNGINIPVKFLLNHGPQEPEIDIHCKYPRCEQHDKLKFNKNKLSRGPPPFVVRGPQVGKH
jgi:hypothetical protein